MGSRRADLKQTYEGEGPGPGTGAHYAAGMHADAVEGAVGPVLPDASVSLADLSVSGWLTYGPGL
jgi:hypothetical protein